MRLAINEDRRLTRTTNDLAVAKSGAWKIFIEDSKMHVELVNIDEKTFKKVISGDESWVYGYNPETKHHSSQWNDASSQ